MNMSVEEWHTAYHHDHPTRKVVMKELLNWHDPYDQFGWAMGWAFAVCHVLHHETAEEIPVKWQYRDGSGCKGLDLDPENGSHEEFILKELLDSGAIDADALLYAGEVLHRFIGALDRAGQSY